MDRHTTGAYCKACTTGPMRGEGTQADDTHYILQVLTITQHEHEHDRAMDSESVCGIKQDREKRARIDPDVPMLYSTLMECECVMIRRDVCMESSSSSSTPPFRSDSDLSPIRRRPVLPTLRCRPLITWPVFPLDEKPRRAFGLHDEVLGPFLLWWARGTISFCSVSVRLLWSIRSVEEVREVGARLFGGRRRRRGRGGGSFLSGCAT